MTDQFDVSPQQRAILVEKAQRRKVLREEFLKKQTNPYRHATGEGGYVFDAALQRFNSMRATGYDHFKPTSKQFFNLVYLVIAPITLSYLFLKNSRTKQEDAIRTGQVAYKDRLFRFQ